MRHIPENGVLKIHRPDIIIIITTTRSKWYSPLLALQSPENFPLVCRNGSNKQTAGGIRVARLFRDKTGVPQSGIYSAHTHTHDRHICTCFPDFTLFWPFELQWCHWPQCSRTFKILHCSPGPRNTLYIQPIVNRILLLVQVNSVLHLKRILKNIINLCKANVNIF